MTEEEPLYLYVPESGDQLNNSKSSGALFTQSLLLLNDGLASGTLLTQYEQMYRKNPDLAITEARKGANALKNRYRDISPCECREEGTVIEWPVKTLFFSCTLPI